MTADKDHGRDHNLAAIESLRERLAALTACRVEDVSMSIEAAKLLHRRDQESQALCAEMLNVLKDLEKITADFTAPAPAPAKSKPHITPIPANPLWKNCEERIIELDQALHNLVDEFPNVGEDKLATSSNPPVQPRSGWKIFTRRLIEAKAVLGD